MKSSYALVSSLFVLAFAVPSHAQEAVHPMSQHPAVLVKRQAASQGYDYQAKFYPHPAWLYLETDHHELGDHPAVLVARRNAEAQAAQDAHAASKSTATALVQAPEPAVR